MRLNLLNNLIILLFLSIVGCSTSAPMLPPDYGSIHPTHVIDKKMFAAEDLNKTCDDIYTENKNLNLLLNNINKDIEVGRTSDQTLVYLFGPALALFDTNSDVQEKREAIQNRLDTVNLLRRYKKC